MTPSGRWCGKRRAATIQMMEFEECREFRALSPATRM